MYCATQLENMKYAKICGGYNKKINSFIAKQIRDKYKEGRTKMTLALAYNLSYRHICKVIKGEIWQES